MEMPRVQGLSPKINKVVLMNPAITQHSEKSVSFNLTQRFISALATAIGIRRMQYTPLYSRSERKNESFYSHDAEARVKSESARLKRKQAQLVCCLGYLYASVCRYGVPVLVIQSCFSVLGIIPITSDNPKKGGWTWQTFSTPIVSPTLSFRPQ